MACCNKLSVIGLIPKLSLPVKEIIEALRHKEKSVGLDDPDVKFLRGTTVQDKLLLPIGLQGPGNIPAHPMESLIPGQTEDFLCEKGCEETRPSESGMAVNDDIPSCPGLIDGHPDGRFKLLS